MLLQDLAGQELVGSPHPGNEVHDVLGGFGASHLDLQQSGGPIELDPDHVAAIYPQPLEDRLHPAVRDLAEVEGPSGGARHGRSWNP